MTKALDPAELARRKAARKAAGKPALTESEKAQHTGMREAGREARMETFSAPVAAEMPAEQLAALLDADSDPLSTVKRVAQAAGLDEKAVRGLLARVRAQYAPLLGELRDVKTSELIRLVEDRAWMAVELIDRESLADLNAYQRAIIFGVLVDKARILKGLPTHIVSVEDRRQLDQVAGLLLKEMQRRGMSVDDRGEMIDITPGSADAARPRQGRRNVVESVELARAAASEESGEAEAGR